LVRDSTNVQWGLFKDVCKCYFAGRMPQPEANPQLAEIHRQWTGINERLREQERQLAIELAVYARGKGPRPDSTIATVQQMRQECAKRFQALMDATRGR